MQDSPGELLLIIPNDRRPYKIDFYELSYFLPLSCYAYANQQKILQICYCNNSSVIVDIC